jgi:hypothetical protein
MTGFLDRLVGHSGQEQEPVEAILLDAGARDFVDQVAPTVYEEHADRMRVGDVWMRGYYVADLPTGVRLDADRFLRPGADTWVSIFIHPLPPEVAATLHRRRTELAGSEIFDRRRGALGSYGRQTQLAAVEQALQEIEVGGRPIYHFSLYMAVIAASEELLEEVCRRVEDYMRGLRVAFYRARWMQPVLEYSLLPAGTDRVRTVRNMTAGALGPLFPFTRRTYYDPAGIPYGLHAVNGTWVVLDPFGPEVSNASHLILGMPGMGKSAYLKRFLELAAVLGHRVVVVDLEGEYRPLVEDLGGTYVALSRTCPHSINLLDPGLGDEDPFGAALSTLIGFLGIAVGRPLTPVERQSIVPYCYHALLQKAGVDVDRPETWRQARQPTLDDLRRLMEEERGPAAELARLLYPYTSDNLYGRLFSRPTNVDISRTPVVGFTLQGVSEEMLAPFLWLVVSLVWREVTAAGGVQPVHLVVDEGWYLMRHPDVGRELGDMARRFRKHNAALHLATHFAQDLVTSEHAQTIRGAVGHVLLFGQQPEEARQIGELFGLSEVEIARLRSFGKGDALLLWNGGRVRVPIYVPLDPRRKWLFETGPEQRQAEAIRRGVKPVVVE